MSLFVYRVDGANQINYMNVSQNVFHRLQGRFHKTNILGNTLEKCCQVQTV